jgi:protein TonB
MNSLALARPAGFFSAVPSLALPAFGRRDGQIGAAVAVSLLIHGVALGWLPGFVRPAEQAGETLPPLHVRLSLSAIRPDPVAVTPAPTLAPPPPARREAPASLHPSAPVAVLAAPEAASPAAERPAARAAEPAAAPSTEVMRPAPPIAPRSPAPDPGMLAAYGRDLASAVGARQRYPRLALVRQWQGTAVLQLDLAAAGGLLGVRVLSSSGHEILDRQALEMVREALPLPPLPAALAGRPLTVDVPVVFRLAS